MSAMLCAWINNEVRLSRAVDSQSFASDFSDGFLLGEILHKYKIQPDFSRFSAGREQENFERLKASLKLLGIRLDRNLTEELKLEKPDAALKLVYQLFVILEKKKNPKLCRKIVWPPPKLKPVVQMDSDDSDDEMDEEARRRKAKLRARPKREKTQIVLDGGWKPRPPSKLFIGPEKRKKQRREKRQQQLKDEISQFEINHKEKRTCYDDTSSCQVRMENLQQQTDTYMHGIRRRVRESMEAMEQKEKRKDRYLNDLAKAHKAQQENECSGTFCAIPGFSSLSIRGGSE